MGIPIALDILRLMETLERGINDFSHNFPMTLAGYGDTRKKDFALTSRLKVRDFRKIHEEMVFLLPPPKR
jgi:hypothetical protein